MFFERYSFVRLHKPHEPPIVMASVSDGFSGSSKKRQRKSRFASRSTDETTRPTNDTAPKDVSSTPQIPDSVSSLRARIAEKKALISAQNGSVSMLEQTTQRDGLSNSDALKFPNGLGDNTNVISDAPVPKRQKTGRSRFTQATPATNVSQTNVPSKSLENLSRAGPPLTSQTQTSQWGAPSSMNSIEFMDVTAIPIAPVKTVNINRKAEKKQKLAAVLKVSKSDLLETDPLKNPYFDPALPRPVRPPRPIRKEMNFVPKGLVAARAEKERERAIVQVNRNNYISKLTDSATNTFELPVLPPLAEDLTLHKNREVPKAEWWDLPFLAQPDNFIDAKDDPTDNDGLLDVTGLGNATDDVKGDVNGVTGDVNADANIELREERITHYIHHPPKITPAKPQREPPAVPLMLTKKEMKKLRRQRRKEANQEQQELIAAGLIPPPPPKVKLSNIMRVLSNEASADPTKVESEVRAQIEARRRKHEANNEARKKSGEEKREKSREKREKDREAGLMAAVYRVLDVSDATNRFKVIRNARQLELTGVILKFNGCNVVVVEGGEKGLRKYKKLMLRRINWQGSEQNSTDNKDELDVDTNLQTEYNETEQLDSSLQKHGCVLVWEGVISSASFEGFRFMEMRGESGCRKMFREHHVEHYWDLCLQASPLGNDRLGVRNME